MDMNKQRDESQLSGKPEFGNAADATGIWFAAAIMCAVLAAGVLVYRSANTDVVTASNDVTPRIVQAHPMANPSQR